MVGFNRRYYSIFHKGLDVIDKHGRLLGVSIEGHERFWKIVNGGFPDTVKENWIYANSTHTIDLLRLLGGEIKSIHTLSKRLKEKNGDQFVRINLLTPHKLSKKLKTILDELSTELGNEVLCKKFKD